MTVGYGSNLSDNFRQERHYVEPSSTLGTVVAGSTIAEKTTASVTISATSTESVTVSVTTTSTSVTGTMTESNELYNVTSCGSIN